MNPDPEKLEHLFSRQLDREATPAEQAYLEALLCNDRDARTRFDELRDLDYELGSALRQAVGRPQHVIRLRPRRLQLARGLAIAAAACIAALAWLYPRPHVSAPTTGSRAPAQAAAAPQAWSSWFVPPERPADKVTPLPTAYVRPELRVRGTARELLVVPGESPGVFFVIEVDRVQTRVIGVHQDF